MTERKYKTFSDAAPGSMRNLRAVKPPAALPDYRTTEVPEHQSTEVPEPSHPPETKAHPEVTTAVPQYRSTAVKLPQKVQRGSRPTIA